MGGNSAPTLSGDPGTGVTAGSTYSYQPVSQDTDGDTLQFSISGKPGWATFSVATGLLSGAPTDEQAGSYENIVISVTDGKTTAALPAFAITVAAADQSLGTAVLSWQPPSQNTDATPVTNVAGYRVYHGFAADALSEFREISAPNVSSFVFDALVSGTHFFAVSTYTFEGVESALSAVVSKTIP